MWWCLILGGRVLWIVILLHDLSRIVSCGEYPWPCAKNGFILMRVIWRFVMLILVVCLNLGYVSVVCDGWVS